MDGWWSRLDILVFVAMFATECSNVGLNTLFKAASSKGLSPFVFMVYTYAIGALLLLPAPFLSHRSRTLSPLNFSILWKMVLLGIVGSVYQLMGYMGVRYSSPTLASAISNVTPAFTFILAVVFRMEKATLDKPSTVAKILGTVVSVAGAFVVTVYKGPPIYVTSLEPSLNFHQSLKEPSSSDWTTGAVCFVVEYTLIPVSYIIQAQIMKEYPAEFTVTFAYNLLLCLISVVFSLVAEKNNPNAWMLNADVSLACVIVNGLLGTFVFYAIHMWAVHVKGPVVVAMFKPLSIIIAVAMGAIFLGDSLYLGSLVGGTLISLGFYTVMWGKAKEEKTEVLGGVDILDSAAAQRAPFLTKHQGQHV